MTGVAAVLSIKSNVIVNFLVLIPVGEKALPPSTFAFASTEPITQEGYEITFAVREEKEISCQAGDGNNPWEKAPDTYPARSASTEALSRERMNWTGETECRGESHLPRIQEAG